MEIVGWEVLGVAALFLILGVNLGWHGCKAWYSRQSRKYGITYGYVPNSVIIAKEKSRQMPEICRGRMQIEMSKP